MSSFKEAYILFWVIARSSPQILVFKYHSWIEGIMASWRNGWFQDRERKAKDEPGPSYGVKKEWEMLKKWYKYIEMTQEASGLIWDNFSNKINDSNRIE